MVKVKLLDADLPGDSVVHAAVVNLDREVAALIESGLVCVSCVVCRVSCVNDDVYFVRVRLVDISRLLLHTNPPQLISLLTS